MAIRPFQFTLLQLLGIMTVIGVFTASILWLGFFATLLYWSGAAVVWLFLMGLAKFDLRYLLAGGLLLFVFLPLFHGTDTVAIGDGSSNLALQLRVIGEDNEPVSNATIHLRDISTTPGPEGVVQHPIPPTERISRGISNSSGDLSLVFRYPNTCKTNLFIDEAYVYISPDLWLQIDTPVHKRKLVRLDSLLGTNRYDWHELPFPPLQVILTPKLANLPSPASE